jgi:N-acetylglucosaminyl-diphospho-decaprenol L-rhamnosyltransferase
MTLNQITPIIVTFKSNHVIERCLKNLTSFNKVLILDNSNDTKMLSHKKKFKNTSIFLSKKNLGFANGNNFLLTKVKTKYALILNPDVFLTKKNIEDMNYYCQKFENKFSILSFKVKNDKNYGYFKNNTNKYYLNTNKNILTVDFVFGCFMLIEKKIAKDIGYFDKNFFLYNEEIDLCERIKKKNKSKKILLILSSKINHLLAKSSNIGLEYIKCKNWHWMWSQFYYFKKRYGYILAFFVFLPKLLRNFFRMILYFLKNEKKQFLKRKMSLYGLLSAYCLRKSFYRPLI